jgi:hypothetical protein
MLRRMRSPKASSTASTKTASSSRPTGMSARQPRNSIAALPG